MTYQIILYVTEESVATAFLNRSERLNTIVRTVPEELSSGVEKSNLDQNIKMIVLLGIGRRFCARWLGNRSPAM